MKMKKKNTVNVKYIIILFHCKYLKCTFSAINFKYTYAKCPLLASETLNRYMLAFSMKYALFRNEVKPFVIL